MTNKVSLPRDTSIGKRVAGHLYVHVTALNSLDPVAVAAVHQATALAEVEIEKHFNVIKLEEIGLDAISLLHYPGFDTEAFPVLHRAWSVRLSTAKVIHRQYLLEGNPPILHRKELLMPPEYPGRANCEALTRALEERGLFAQAAQVGHKRQWEARLASAGIGLDDLQPKVNQQALERSVTSASSGNHEWTTAIARHKTAMTRYAFSVPMRLLSKYGYLDGQFTIFDYGCGKGDDLRLLEANAIPCAGWDPHFRPTAPRQSADVVNLGYVLNVIESAEERAAVLSQAFVLAQKLLLVSVIDSSKAGYTGAAFSDGIVTQRGTFQKFFDQQEIRDFIEATLDTRPIALAPGIFAIFRDEIEEQRFLEARSRNRMATSRLMARISRPSTKERQQAFYNQHQAELDRLWNLWLELGRRPLREDLSDPDDMDANPISLAKALRFLEDLHGAEILAEAATAKRNDLTIYFALQQFSRRRTYRTWPDELKRDVRALFGSAAGAVEAGRDLLFSLSNQETIAHACQEAESRGLGWLDEDAFTCATRNAGQLPPALRAYIGCGTMLYGDVTNADLIKIHILSAKLTLMAFDNFDENPLPRMLVRTKIQFRTQVINNFQYGESYEPPYLYYKSRFLDKNDPQYFRQKQFDDALRELLGEEIEGYGPTPKRLGEILRLARTEIDNFELVPSKSLPELDDPCGRYFRFRDFIDCGETQQKMQLQNLPKNPESYNALATLANKIIDPVIDYFGMIQLTFGFCSSDLAKEISGRIDPKLDQHAAHELNRLGKFICPRLGAAVDFIVQDENMLEVAQWVAGNTPFDRLYFYGNDRPIHVSYGPDHKRQVVAMVLGKDDRMIPRVLKVNNFTRIK